MRRPSPKRAHRRKGAVAVLRMTAAAARCGTGSRPARRAAAQATPGTPVRAIRRPVSWPARQQCSDGACRHIADRRPSMEPGAGVPAHAQEHHRPQHDLHDGEVDRQDQAVLVSRGVCPQEQANRSRTAALRCKRRLAHSLCRSRPTRAHCLLRQERRGQRLSCMHCHLKRSSKGRLKRSSGLPAGIPHKRHPTVSSSPAPLAPLHSVLRGAVFFWLTLLQCVFRHKACTSACSDSAQARRSRPQEGWGSPKRTIASSGGALSTFHSEVARLSSSM